MTMPHSAKPKKKVAMDASILDRYVKFLLGFKDKEIEIIWRSAHICKLPSNPEPPEVLDVDIKDVFPSCYVIPDPEAGERIKERIAKLKEFHEDPEDRALLAEAEEVGIEVLLTANEDFINDLGPRAQGVSLMTPAQYREKFPAPSAHQGTKSTS